ncbi:MAG TPA: protease pro-enzyme activation domain-containing protein [Bryobacteraceae bacterium]|nr:protease pro-enzyme activation domain-containing protein [Bryobacteraceae bacterium]
MLWVALASVAAAGPVDRVLRPVDPARTTPVPGNVPRLAQAQFDRGAVDDGMRMEYMVLLMKPSAAQQADLDQLLAGQQNPSSPQFLKWLTPEEFGNRFGLSTADHSKVVAWLASQGFQVNQSARGRNWVAFSGTAGLVTHALHTPIHRFQVNGETHFANTSDPQVPEALADVVGGFLGLNDFHPKSQAVLVPPDYTLNNAHYLVPEDYGTIYDIAPLVRAGIDGTNQSIAIVGESDVLASDLAAFRTRYNLPANTVRMILYGGSDPGLNGAELEGDLDLEWSGAIAPKATIYYIYGASAFSAIVVAVDLDVAPIISASYSSCEVDASIPYYRSIAQQANAQGITILAASGDAGAAACDVQGSEPLATRGLAVNFPAVMPEVTGVGGTEFVEGNGTYWASTNTANFGSALSYIPEAAWNESATTGLLSTGGGASVLYSRPAWQTGPGVPNDAARHVPDVALSAAGHDAYEVTYSGSTVAVSGTSCGTPSLAGVLALLNQYQVTKGFQSQPGLGNINPQLYRLAQSAPSAFHDVISGNNLVPCSQGSPDCLTGSLGYQATAGYDMTTGLGSLDVNNLVTNWNTQSAGVSVNLVTSAATVTVNNTLSATLLVGPAAGVTGTPTGTVTFSVEGTALGTVPLVARGALQAADLTFPVYQLGTGSFLLTASYSGDATFSSGGATKIFQITVPTGAAGILVTAPFTVWPGAPPDPQGLGWQTTITLSEVAGVPALITGFSMDGEPQTLAQYFLAPQIPANRSVSTTFTLRNVVAPVNHTFGITGTDADGNSWSRQVTVGYAGLPPYSDFNLTATPLAVSQETSADPSCQWPVHLTIDDLGGYLNLISQLDVGSISLNSQIPAIFGTTRVDAWGSVGGTVCFSGITPPATDYIAVYLSSGVAQQVAVTFSGPPANPSKITAAPANLVLNAVDAAHPAEATLAVGISDKTQPWTITILPTNRNGAWLAASQYAGTGPAQLALTATGTGFEPGAYQASIVIQSPNAMPQTVTVPVMFVLGGSTSGTAITGVGNAALLTSATQAPGGLLTIFGTGLANATTTATGNPLAYSLAGVTATVNSLPAPILYAAAGQINIQVPYAAGAGPAVLGINNNGQVAGFQIQLTAAAPQIFQDSGGNVAGQATAKQGGLATLYLTGAGEVSPALKTAYSTTATTYTLLQSPSVTVGGVPALIQYAGLAPGLVGIAQLNIIVPASVPAGPQPVVVTAAGIASAAATITVQPAQ